MDRIGPLQIPRARGKSIFPTSGIRQFSFTSVENVERDAAIQNTVVKRKRALCNAQGSARRLRQTHLMNPYHFLEQLIDLERRVRAIYRLLSEQPQFTTALRSFWAAMVDDETHHIVTLERSAHVPEALEHPPAIADTVLASVEHAVATAEARVQSPTLTGDDALRQALLLEGSELNRLDDAWLHGFRITTSLLLRALASDLPSHIRRLVDAVHRCSADETLHAQADALWATYQQQHTKDVASKAVS